MAKEHPSESDAVAELKALVATLQGENKLLNQKVQMLLRRLFGSKSEVIDPAQLQLLLSNMDVESSPDPDDDLPPSSPPPGGGKKRRKNKPRIPENLPTEDVQLDPDEVKDSPLDYKRIGEEVTSELDVVPPQYFRRRIIRGKYVKRDDKDAPPIIAPLPERLIEGSYASAGIIADIVIKKYQDHLPLYRQEQILKNRFGIDLSRQTMDDWVRSASDWLSPIYRLLRKNLQASSYLQVDETPIRYCDKDGPPGGRKGYFWVYHDPWAKEVLYEWHTGRAAACMDDVLGKFKGTVQCDGYGAYTSYAKGKEHIDIACCWAHARRKFYEAKDESPGVASWFLKQIQALYATEAYLRSTEAEPERRRMIRENDSRWRLDLLRKALKSKMATYLPKSQMGKAVHYALARWDELTKYCGDGRIEIDNNGVENAIRPTAVGKKNWLFIGHPQAGDRSAIIYTIIENCKKLGINPQEYLKDVLTRLPSMKMSEVDQLLPATWLAERTAEAA
jgi:transposase